MSLSFADGTYVELPDDAPDVYRGYDYGSYLPGLWDDVVDFADERDLGALETFVCPEPLYFEILDHEEALDEAEEEEDEPETARLEAQLARLRPAHDPADLLRIVEPLIEALEADPKAFDPDHEPDSSLAETVIVELGAYRLALQRAVDEGRRVFINPF